MALFGVDIDHRCCLSIICLKMMKLRRKFSGVLPSKKPNSDLPSHIVPLTTITEVDIDEPIPEDWHESQLQDAVIESLRDQHQSLERDLTTKNGEITQLRQQLDRDGEEKAQRDALVEFNARLQKELRETVMRMTTENEMLRREHDRQISEHNKMVTEQLNTIKEYQIYAVNMSEDHIRLQGQVNSLNSDRTSLLLSMDRPLAEAVNGEATAVQKARAMEAELAQARSQIEQIATLKTRNNELTVKVTNLETELSEVREAAEVKAEEHTKAIIAAKGSVLGMDPTPRAILSFKMLSKGFQETVVTDRPEVTLFMRVCSLETLTNQSLDMRLSQNQAERFANSVTSDDLALLVCDLCQLPKLRRKPGAEHSLRISEFPSMAQATSCCSKNICTTCYLAGITASLYTNWWNSLSRRNWINCPAHNCSSPVLGRGTPESLLQELGDSQIRVNMDM